MEAVSNVDIINNSLKQQSGEHMGDIVGWNQYGSHNRTAVMSMLERFGLDMDVDMPNVTAISAYRRTVAKVARVGSRDERKYEIVKIEDTPTKIVHAVVRKDIVIDAKNSLTDPSAEQNPDQLTNKDADFETETKFAFDKERYMDGVAPELLFKCGHYSHPLAIEAKKMYDSLCVVYTAEDIRQGFQRAFKKWGGLRLLDKGGCWWVPPTVADRVRDWNRFMVELKNTTMILPLFDTAETVGSLQNLTRDSLDSQLEDLFNQLDSFGTKDNTRISTLERRLEAFEDLQNKAELYERLLGHQLDEIKTKVSGASTALAKTINELTAQKG